MKEDFLQYIWVNSLYGLGEYTTYSGKKIRILEPGQLNRDAGPDFFNARILMDDVVMAGNVEIHLKSSDWFRHKHHEDAAYNNVILSVVKEDDVRIYNKNGKEVECVTLEYAEALYDEYIFMQGSRRQPGCYRRLETLDDAWFYFTLQSYAVERLERKVNDIRGILEQTGNDWEECFYRLLCKYWSGNVNSDAFYQLALVLPYKVILKYADRPFAVEALLMGCSGFLANIPADEYTTVLKDEFNYLKAKHKLDVVDPVCWKFMRIRPDSFPTVRLALLAALLCRFGNLTSRILETDSVEDVVELLGINASSYWNTHYTFGNPSVYKEKRMGYPIRNIIIINAVVPFLFVYGRERGEEKYVDKALAWLEKLKPESNYIITSWEECGFVFDSAMQTQALIQLRKEYCDRHRCLNCKIGREVLKQVSS